MIRISHGRIVVLEGKGGEEEGEAHVRHECLEDGGCNSEADSGRVHAVHVVDEAVAEL